MATAMSEWVRVTRRRWGLSQSQFARLFATSVRTVRRWETGQLEPQEHQQWLFSLLLNYANINGVNRLLRRFLQESGRFSKPGRPA